MESRQTLTSSEIRTGQDHYITGSLFNGIAFACLADNVLLLFAIANGVGPLGQGALASMMFLTMPLALLGRLFVARHGAAKVWGSCFFLRGLSASLMMLAPFMKEWIGPVGAQAVILIGAMGFFAFRSTAASTFAALIGEVTGPRDRGSVMARASMGFQVSYAVFLLIVAFLLGLDNGDRTYLGVILIGTLAGMYAGTRFWCVPETDAPRRGAAVPVMQNLRRIWEETVLRREVFCQVAVYTANALVVSFSMLALKRGYGVSDRDAILYAILLLVGNVMASKFCQLVSDRVGPRPLIIIFSCGTMACSLLWSLAPGAVAPFFLVLVFFLVGFCTNGATFSMGHYIQTATPKSILVGVGMVCQLTSGIVAGVAGTVLGGFGILAIESAGVTGLDAYKLYFAIVFVLQIGLVFMVRGLVPQKDWRIRDVLGLLGSFRDMKTMMILGRIGNAASPDEERLEIDILGDMESRVSEDALLEYLNSPDFTIRYQAVTHLGRFAFGEKTARALIRELREGMYTTAPQAALYLGKHGIREAIPDLRAALESDDIYLRSRCIYALSTLEDAESYPRIRELYRTADNPRIILNGARALVRMGGEGDFALLLSRADEVALPREVRREICLTLARFAGCAEPYYSFIRGFAFDRSRALRDLAEYLRAHTHPSVARHGTAARLADLFERGAPAEDMTGALRGLAETSEDRFGPDVASFLARLGGGVLPEELAYALLFVLTCRVEGGEDGAAPDSLTVLLNRDALRAGTHLR